MQRREFLKSVGAGLAVASVPLGSLGSFGWAFPQVYERTLTFTNQSTPETVAWLIDVVNSRLGFYLVKNASWSRKPVLKECTVSIDKLGNKVEWLRYEFITKTKVTLVKSKNYNLSDGLGVAQPKPFMLYDLYPKMPWRVALRLGWEIFKSYLPGVAK